MTKERSKEGGVFLVVGEIFCKLNFGELISRWRTRGPAEERVVMGRLLFSRDRDVTCLVCSAAIL